MQIFAYLNTDEKKDYNHNNNPDDNEEELGGSYTEEGVDVNSAIHRFPL